jgi:hypothetical protein
MAVASIYGKNSLAAKYATEALFGTVYTTAPGATAGTEPTGGTPVFARKPLTWSAPANGVITASAVFDIPAGTTIVGTGTHTAATGGSYVDGKAETPASFPAQDTVTVTFTFSEV